MNTEKQNNKNMQRVYKTESFRMAYELCNYEKHRK